MSRPQDPRDPSRSDHDREEVAEDWARVREEAVGFGQDAAAQIRQRVDAHPLAAAGLAVTLGFVAGGGLPKAATTVLLGIGARFAASFLSDQVEAVLNGDGP